ncbi:MAG: winged helix-turn-helix domain-containing protein [Actinomycetota bacterium]|nr:winged helix-turn-helix domain-containing protein [Actinomycetota bacterium]
MGRSVLTFTTADALRCRFVRSLLWETLHAVRTLVSAPQQRLHASWLATIDAPAARRELPVLLALNPRHGWVPDFLAPPPQAGRRTFEDELAEVLTHPDELVADDLRRSLDSSPSRSRQAILATLIARPAIAREVIAAELAHAWTRIVAPFWTSLRELIDADITFRTVALGWAGLGPVLAELHRNVRWAEDRVVVDHSDPVDIELDGQGLALMPSAFVWPRTILVYERPWPPTLVYPARGIGELWTAPRRPPAALVGILGRTRALLLLDLEAPATPSALAGRHHLSRASTCTQLIRLRDARLVVGERVGKEVRYRRTPLGDKLASVN